MNEIKQLQQEIGEEIYNLHKEGKLDLKWTGAWGSYEFILQGEIIEEPIHVSIYKRHFHASRPINIWIKSKYAKKIFKEQQEKDLLDKNKKFAKMLKYVRNTINRFKLIKAD